MALSRTSYPKKPSDTWRGLQGQLYRDIQPPAGFVLPAAGTMVECLTDYLTPAMHRHVVIPAGAVGTVQECRTPDCSGYHGICMYFDQIAFAKGAMGQPISVYPSGIVIPYDYAADPQIFRYSGSSSLYSP